MANNPFQNNIRVVALGGGHGLGRLLSAFGFLGDQLTGIVTTTDNGGSTGRLREETGCIAWGDLRNCLSQLTTQKDLKNLLFDFRFDDNSGSLEGHSLGNLMLLALDKMSVRPMDTLNLFREFFHIKPQIIPMTELPVHLAACDSQGCAILGEVNIDAQHEIPQNLKIIPEVPATREAISAINTADLILLGPGSFLTSVLPPLLVTQIRDAIIATKAPKILIANMVPEEGPTGNIALRDKMLWMEEQIGFDLPDAIIWPQSRELIGDAPDNLTTVDLFYSEHERLHDRDKLVNAVSAVYSKLINEKNQHPRKAG